MLTTADGLEVKSAEATYAEADGIVRIPGAVEFKKDRMTRRRVRARPTIGIATYCGFSTRRKSPSHQTRTGKEGWTGRPPPPASRGPTTT